MDKPKRILIVDDEESLRTVLREMIQSLGHESEIAQDGFEALAMLQMKVDLVLLDVMMPGMDGFEVARRIRKDPVHSDTPIIMVTGLASRTDRLNAVAVGANDFISKPFDLTELRVRTESLLKMKEAQDQIKKHKTELEQTVDERTQALRKALSSLGDAQRKLQDAYLDIIRRLAVAAEYKDKHTSSHIFRMSRFSAMLARKVELPPGEVELILHASPMHDVGKIGVADDILLKPGKLSSDEWEIMRQHPTIGSHIMSESKSDLLQAGEIIAASHHEKWDGSGYPNNLSGDEIPLWGRICAIADVFDAVTSDRPYKKAYPNEKAFEIIDKGKGDHFDPTLAEVFLQSPEEIESIQEEVNRDLKDNNFMRMFDTSSPSQ